MRPLSYRIVRKSNRERPAAAEKLRKTLADEVCVISRALTAPCGRGSLSSIQRSNEPQPQGAVDIRVFTDPDGLAKANVDQARAALYNSTSLPKAISASAWL